MGSDEKLMPCGSYDAPVATIRYANVGDLKNEMPQVMSCIDLPDGNYEVYLRPAREEVSGEEFDRVSSAVERELDVREMVDAAPSVIRRLHAKRIAIAAIAAMNPKPAEAVMIRAKNGDVVPLVIPETAGDEENIELQGQMDPASLFAELAERGMMESIGYVEDCPATPATEKAVNPDTVAFVQEWMMSGEHEADQWHRDFAAAIDARTAPPAADVAAMREAQLVKALGEIRHSITQARIPGNDWRRELVLIENIVQAALPEGGA